MLRILVAAACLPAFAFAQVESEARVKLTVLAFQNMENGWHITDRGNKLILADGRGQVFAYGEMSPRLMFTAKAKDQNAGYYTQTTELTVPLSLMRTPSQLSGRGRLKICIPQDPYAKPERMVCRKLSNGFASEDSVEENGLKLHRHWQFDHEVDYQVQGKTVIITRWYGINDYESLGPQASAGVNLQGGGVAAPATSVAHPVSSAGAQGKGTKKDFQSPLVLDLNGNAKTDLLSVWDDQFEVYFDLNGDGVKTRTGWVGREDGLLFIDRDGNGVVSDGRELFSEYSWAYSLAERQPQKRFKNGFAALAQYDHNHDQVLDDKDPAFKYLSVWADKNQDGASQPNELFSLAKLGIESFNLFYQKLAEPYHSSLNEVRLVSDYQTSDGRKHKIWDVWFRMRAQSQIAGDQQ